MVPPGSVLAVQASAASAPLVLVSVVIFLHGMTTSSSLGYAGLVYPHHTSANSSLLSLTEEQATWLVSVSPLAMNLGVFLSIPLGEWLGRKKMFLLSNVLSLLGYLAMYLAPTYAVLLAARVAQVAGMGLADVGPAVYLAEVATVKTRGPLSGVSMTASVVGTLFYTALCIRLPIQYLSLAFLAHNLLVAVLVAALLPESPQWAVRRGREAAARRGLRTLRGAAYQGVELEVAEIREVCKQQEAAATATLAQAATSRTFLLPLATCAVLFVCVGLAGNDTMVFYGPTICALIDVGVEASTLATLPWIGFSLGYALSSPLMARMDRVPQFVSAAAVMAASMLCLGAMVELLERGVAHPAVPAALVTSLMAGTTAYGLGVGAVAYTLLGELFTPAHRNMGASMAQLVRGATMFLLSSLVPTAIEAFGLASLFIFHGGVCAVVAVFVWRAVPETRNKTLTELSNIYTGEPPVAPSYSKAQEGGPVQEAGAKNDPESRGGSAQDSGTESLQDTASYTLSHSTSL